MYIYLRDGTIVPRVAMMWETITDKPQLALLDILFDGIPWLILANFHFGVGMAWDFHHHIYQVPILSIV